MLLKMVFLCSFCPCDTNLVLMKFEKCAKVLEHVVSPRGANWMHILYQVCLLPLS